MSSPRGFPLSCSTPLILHSLEFAVAILLALVFVCPSEAQHRSWWDSKPKFRIVFDYNPDYPFKDSAPDSARLQESDVWVMDQFGGHVKRLTSDHHSHHPAWSLDGRQILFLHSEPIQAPKNTSDCNYPLLTPRDVFRMDANGRNVNRVSSAGLDAQDVAWFPDGKNVAIRISNRRDLQVAIGHTDPSGTLQIERRETFQELLGEDRNANPKWCTWPRVIEFYPPVDNFLPAFYATRINPFPLMLGSLKRVRNMYTMLFESFQGVYSFLPDTEAYANVVQLDGTPSSVSAPAFDATWSLDGKWVAFSKFPDQRNSQLFVAEIQGGRIGNAHAITDEKLQAHVAAWSADGSRLAFVGLWRNTSQIFIVNSDGTGLIQLSWKSELSCTHPSWSPDGKLIVAECRPPLTGSGPFGDLLGDAWRSDITLFEVHKPRRVPRRLTFCTGYDMSSGPPYPGPPHWDGRGYYTPPCRAHNPSFAPPGASVP